MQAFFEIFAKLLISSSGIAIFPIREICGSRWYDCFKHLWYRDIQTIQKSKDTVLPTKPSNNGGGSYFSGSGEHIRFLECGNLGTRGYRQKGRQTVAE